MSVATCLITERDDTGYQKSQGISTPIGPLTPFWVNARKVSPGLRTLFSECPVSDKKKQLLVPSVKKVDGGKSGNCKLVLLVKHPLICYRFLDSYDISYTLVVLQILAVQLFS